MTRFTNVVLITIDSLRADHLSCYGYSRKTSPTIDTLAANGIQFSTCLSNSPTTLTSFKTLFTSTYPTMYHDKFLSKKRTTVAEVLQKNGVTTAGFHCNPFLSKYWGYHRGFDLFYDSVLFSEWISEDKITGKVEGLLNWMNFVFFTFSFHAFGTPYEESETINRKILSWLGQQQKNFFLWIHYMDVHFPYLPPRKYRKQFSTMSKARALKLNTKLLKNPDNITKEELEGIVALYDAGIKQVDDGLAVIIDRIRKKGILHDTLVIITSDHGDEFLDHGGFGHSTTPASQDPLLKPLFSKHRNVGLSLGTKFGYPPNHYDELLHVPLILSTPQVQKPMTIHTLVQLLDIPPTIADAVGIGRVQGFLGQSLLPLVRNDTQSYKERGVLSENVGVQNAIKRSYRTDKWKVIVNENNTCELYNLQNDPQEQHDLRSTHPKKIDELLNKMHAERKRAEQASIQQVIKKGAFSA